MSRYMTEKKSAGTFSFSWLESGGGSGIFLNWGFVCTSVFKLMCFSVL